MLRTSAVEAREIMRTNNYFQNIVKLQGGGGRG